VKIKEMNSDSRPRERLVKFGVETLSDAELLAIILRTGTIKENVIEMSNRIINEFGLNKLADYSLKELQEIKGIGLGKACQLLAINELNKRVNSLKNKVTKISTAQDVFNFFKDKFKDEKQENFYILMLNPRNHIIKEEFITKGVLDAAIIHPREIFKPAIKNSASKIILVHNHPSGDSNPSPEDLDITEQIIEVGNKIGIKVIDHVIVGKDEWWSWIERGLTR
jgi:DNA repair protein RadC